MENVHFYFPLFEHFYIDIYKQTTPQMLGLKLQAFKEANQKLIAEIRKKY